MSISVCVSNAAQHRHDLHVFTIVKSNGTVQKRKHSVQASEILKWVHASFARSATQDGFVNAYRMAHSLAG
jgi:hypothetical protein